MKRPSIAGLGVGMALVVLGLLATGCASILKGSDQKVSFNSEPSDAKVVITDVRQANEEKQRGQQNEDGEEGQVRHFHGIRAMRTGADEVLKDQVATD